MRALIVLVSNDLQGRFERCLPPEHRVRAEKHETDRKHVELVIEGPTLPEVVDGDFKLGTIQLTVHSDEASGQIWLEACWFFMPVNEVSMSEHWEVGHWSSVAEMMDFMR